MRARAGRVRASKRVERSGAARPSASVSVVGPGTARRARSRPGSRGRALLRRAPPGPRLVPGARPGRPGAGGLGVGGGAGALCTEGSA